MTELHTILIGTRTDSYLKGMKISEAITSSVVLIIEGDKKSLIDTGGPGYAEPVLGGLANLGVKPEDVDYLINTHYHIDHTYNNYLFQNARIIQGSSMWTVKPVNKVEMFGDVERMDIPGVKLFNTPGHTPKHFSILVCIDSRNIVVAGDAIRASTIDQGYIPKEYDNPQEYIDSMKKILEIADEIIPGHGPIIKKQQIGELKKKAQKLTIR